MRSALLCLAILAAFGCQTYSTGSHGNDLSPQTAAMVKPGMTQSEVRDLLGTPTHVTLMGEGRELWAYRYRIHRENRKVFYIPIRPEERLRPDGAIYVLFLSTGKAGQVRRG